MDWFGFILVHFCFQFSCFFFFFGFSKLKNKQQTSNCYKQRNNGFKSERKQRRTGEYHFGIFLFSSLSVNLILFIFRFVSGFFLLVFLLVCVFFFCIKIVDEPSENLQPDASVPSVSTDAARNFPRIFARSSSYFARCSASTSIPDWPRGSDDGSRGVIVDAAKSAIGSIKRRLLLEEAANLTQKTRSSSASSVWRQNLEFQKTGFHNSQKLWFFFLGPWKKQKRTKNKNLNNSRWRNVTEEIVK